MPNWNEVFNEINRSRDRALVQAKGSTDIVRRRYLRKLFKHTGRNVVAYYSGFLSKPDVPGSEINDEDKNGFMMAVHQLDRSKGLDLILHTPGGGIAATESIVDYLRQMFGKNIRAIVPQIAMSAGTMIACCCQSILMTKHSNLGPIDPQIRGIAAQGVIDEFKRAHAEIKADPSMMAVWGPIIGKYHPTFLKQCESAIQWSQDFVTSELRGVMFENDSNAQVKAERIVKSLMDYDANRAHERHIHYDQCKQLGLNVALAENDKAMQDLLLTVHHCYMHSLMNTPSYKMIENHLGYALVKQVRVQQIPIQMPTASV